MGHLKWIHIHTRHKLTKTPKKNSQPIRWSHLPCSGSTSWSPFGEFLKWKSDTVLITKSRFSARFSLFTTNQKKNNNVSALFFLRQYVVVKVIAVVGLGQTAVFASSLFSSFSGPQRRPPKVPTSMAKFREPPEARHRNGRTWKQKAKKSTQKYETKTINET